MRSEDMLARAQSKALRQLQADLQSAATCSGCMSCTPHKWSAVRVLLMAYAFMVGCCALPGIWTASGDWIATIATVAGLLGGSTGMLAMLGVAPLRPIFAAYMAVSACADVFIAGGATWLVSKADVCARFASVALDASMESYCEGNIARFRMFAVLIIVLRVCVTLAATAAAVHVARRCSTRVHGGHVYKPVPASVVLHP